MENLINADTARLIATVSFFGGMFIGIMFILILIHHNRDNNDNKNKI